MKIINQDNNMFVLELKKQEFDVVSRCASHVLHSFAMGEDYNILESTGWEEAMSKSFANLLKTKESELTDNGVILQFSFEEVKYMIAAIRDAIQYIGWEFQTLLAYTIDEAAEVMQSLQEIILDYSKDV